MTISELKAWIAAHGGPLKASALLGINPSTLWRWTQGKPMNPMLEAKIKEIG